ncbi:MAG: hypothetical protein LBD04_01495 [Synergistaceae bacterium]|jgi:hypothetical protein|nr:hypothetical protein [Synergistaceae bacterium]
MAERREVSLVIGRRSYRVQTALDDDTLARVTEIVQGVGEAVGAGVDQNHLLMLTCLQLAYSLEKISGALQPLENRLAALSLWDSLDRDETD